MVERFVFVNNFGLQVEEGSCNFEVGEGDKGFAFEVQIRA